MDGRAKNGNIKKSITDFMICLFLLVGATAVGYFFRMAHFPETNIVIVFILAVLLTARLTEGFFFGVVESILATCTFNYFFTSPYFTLNVDNPSYFITFIIMTVTAFMTGAITSRAKMNALTAKDREKEAMVLYQLTNRLTAAAGMEQIASVAAAGIGDLLKCETGCMPTAQGMTEYRFLLQTAEGGQTWQEAEDGQELMKALTDGNVESVAGREFSHWPIRGKDSLLGVIRVPADRMEQIRPEQLRVFHFILETVAITMDRLLSVERQIRDKEMMEKERGRANLLRSISHDLRTPLTGIMGTSEMLMDMTDKGDSRMELLKDIYRDAAWLHHLVENILSLTRLQDGKLLLHKEREVCEEVTGAALRHMKKRAPDREFVAELPEELLMVPMDARLIEQALINLLDNAVKHTGKNGRITLSVAVEENDAAFAVADQGCGIAEKDMPFIFQLFYTTNGEHTDKKQGIGLGLAICEAIVRAHGGRIKAENKKDGNGAVFTFYLPLSEKERTEEGGSFV